VICKAFVFVFQKPIQQELRATSAKAALTRTHTLSPPKSNQSLLVSNCTSSKEYKGRQQRFELSVLTERQAGKTYHQLRNRNSIQLRLEKLFQPTSTHLNLNAIFFGHVRAFTYVLSRVLSPDKMTFAVLEQIVLVLVNFKLKSF